MLQWHIIKMPAKKHIELRRYLGKEGENMYTESLRLGDNIALLRHKKKVTQEELAEFVGVTKASVSKWETKISMPDIALLPQIASYFDITIDELLGYESQISLQQAKKIYQGFANDFATQPFDEVYENVKAHIKKYYSCYSFLHQMCCLLLNHFMIAPTKEYSILVLEETEKLCNHILADCKDIGLCNDTRMLLALIDLQLGKTMEVVDNLEELIEHYRITAQCDTTLTQAYIANGQMDKADENMQISIYSHLMSMVSSAVLSLTIHVNDLSLCEETIRRMDAVMDVFHMDTLNANAAAVFSYHAAIVYCVHQKYQETLNRLDCYVKHCIDLLSMDELRLGGDEYFNKVDAWYERMELGGIAPRSKKLVWESVEESLKNPVFDSIRKDAQFDMWYKKIEGGKKNG